MMLERLARVDEHARRMAELATEPVVAGGFTAFFPEGAAAYAVPAAPPEDPDRLAAELDALAAVFARRHARLRVELVMLAWPALAAALAARGLEVVDETPLFVLPRASAPAPPPPGIDVRWVGEGDDLAFIAQVMRQGWEQRGAVPAGEAAAAMRAALAGPLRLALAELDGLPAGSGCAAGTGGVCEISMVSTLPALRRRGVARALIGFLAAQCFAAGGELCWACAPDTRAAALLLGAGFDDAGLRVCFAEREGER